VKFGPDHYDRAFSKTYDEDRYLDLWDLIRSRARGAESVLDLGCGLGRLLGDWEDPPARRVGLDFSMVAIAKATERYAPAVMFWRATFEELLANPPDSPDFEVIFLCEVLEHVEYDQGLFAYAKTRASKRVVASVPYGDRVRCKSHTATRYYPDTIGDRFGEVRIVSAPDSKFLVFETDT
jgi:SAM-dependent methyltransferase